MYVRTIPSRAQHESESGLGPGLVLGWSMARPRPSTGSVDRPRDAMNGAHNG